MRLRTPRQWRRARRTLVALAVAGLLLVLWGRLAGGLTLFGFGLLGLVLLESAQLRRFVLESDRQQQALIHLRPLLGDVPLDLGRWAADPVMVHHAVRLLTETRPAVVVECGSGSSTVVIARCLRGLGRGRVISLEHDPVYAHRTMELLRLYHLDDLATVVTAPLAARETNGRSVQWYGPQYESFVKESIDVLLVDGPPKASGPRARYPAIPILKRDLAPECWIMLDDGDRPDEREIAHAWRSELGATLTYLEGGRGGWLLHRQATATGSRQADP